MPDSSATPPSLLDTRPASTEPGTTPWRDIAAYLHPDEAAPDFERLSTDLLTALAPADMIERLWCDDITALVWESHRLRRAKRVLLATQSAARIRLSLLNTRISLVQTDRILAAYRQGDEAAIKTVQQALAANPLAHEDGVALDHLDTLDQMLVIDRAIEASDKRRDTLLSNLYIRREMLDDHASVPGGA